MSDQLDISGRPALAPPDVKLTTRQRLALDYIAAHAPVPSDELGAVLHEERSARGGRGHSADERCEWCATEGKTAGAALRAKGLVRHRNGEGGGWYVPSIGSRGQANAQDQEIPY